MDTEVLAVESDSDMEVEQLFPPATPPAPEPDGSSPPEEKAVPEPSAALDVSQKARNRKVRPSDRSDPLVGVRVEVPGTPQGSSEKNGLRKLMERSGALMYGQDVSYGQGELSKRSLELWNLLIMLILGRVNAREC